MYIPTLKVTVIYKKFMYLAVTIWEFLRKKSEELTHTLQISVMSVKTARFSTKGIQIGIIAVYF